jgi:hypothetical protein
MLGDLLLLHDLETADYHHLFVNGASPEVHPKCPFLAVWIVGFAEIPAALASKSDSFIEELLSADTGWPFEVALPESDGFRSMPSGMVVAARAQCIAVFNGSLGIRRATLFVIRFSFQFLLQIPELQAGKFVLNLAGFERLLALLQFQPLQFEFDLFLLS